MTTALCMLPIIGAASLAMEKLDVREKEIQLQAAVDAAALSAVVEGAVSDKAREAHAKVMFDKNFDVDIPSQVKAKSAGDILDVFGSAQVPSPIGSIIGVKDHNIYARSRAKVTKDAVTCLLVLDPHGKAALQISGNISFNAPNCAVQVNSDHAVALTQSGPNKPLAQSVCVTGGASGGFDPFINTQCRPVADPYANVQIPDIGSCTDIANLGAKKGQIFEISDNAILQPGTYCGALSFVGRNIRLRPGLYQFVDGPLSFGKSGQVLADDVTLILRGVDSYMDIEQGAMVDITASRTGDFGGIAIYGMPENKGTPLPEYKSVLSSGGQLNVTGVVYFPAQEITITGQSGFGSRAPATSFIAYRVKMAGRVNIDVRVDHSVAGLPPFKPRIEGGPVLLK